MNRYFYLKMALQNIRKNKQIYVPFILAATGMVSLYCIFAFMTYNTGLTLIRGGDTVKSVLNTGCHIMEIFSVVFLFYTNSFLIKQRKRELGLYCVLGMEKKHVAKILSRETLFCGSVSVGGGILFGILFSKACYIILLRIVGSGVKLGFMAPQKAVGRTLFLFFLLFLAIYIYNSSCVKMIRPLELLQSGKKGEKEPRAKWVMALLSIGMIGAGYYLAITSGSPIEALSKFFIAVLLVIGGTYGLFVSVVVGVLKILQKNKKYYYQTSHFAAVSGLQYRMKRNGISLANICILSTAVLVMISTTAAIYAQVYSKETVITMNGGWLGEKKTQQLMEELEPVLEKYGKTKEDVFTMKAGGAICKIKGDSFERFDAKGGDTPSDLSVLEVMDAANFEKSTGEEVSLKKGEALVYIVYGSRLSDKITVAGEEYNVKEYRQGSPYPATEASVSKSYFMVVNSEEQVEEIGRALSQTGEFRNKDYGWYWYLSPELDKDGEIALASGMRAVAEKYNYKVDCGEENNDTFIAVNGSLLFIGIFLGIVFMLAAVLIIYYKQLTEGYEDSERFDIMCKVGMSKEEVKASIRSQVLLVFFLPVLTAGVHLLAASPCLKKVLMAFQVTEMRLFNISMLVTYGIFMLVYVCVYGLTARVYYHIVNAE